MVAGVAATGTLAIGILNVLGIGTGGRSARDVADTEGPSLTP